MFWFLLTTALPALIYWFLIRPHSFWTRRGVIQGKPTFLLGDLASFIFRKRSIPELNQDLYNYSTTARYVGIYQFLRPALLIRDPDLIKQITVKDFDHFLDHQGFVAPEADPLLGKTLFSLQGQNWRDMRSKLSPSFTSSKMKYMFTLMSKSGQKFLEHFLQKTENLIEVEMKDITSRFANDIIANTVFGFECDSMKEPKNEFYSMGKEVTDFTSFRKICVFLGYVLIPFLLKLFKVTLFSDRMNQYFHKIIEENIESREKHGVSRPDMINLLLEARKNNDEKPEDDSLPDAGFATVKETDSTEQKQKKLIITNDDIVSQAFIFFFAGFDSVSTLMSFMSYELAANHDVQTKLIQEVDNVKKNQITYEDIASMKYMDMVVSETLRKWPNAIATDRVCTKPITILPNNPNEKPIHLNKNDLIILPIYAIHRDPKYYPEPDRFDPERFNEENKSKIAPFTYFPFGTGPRSCIGSRFALLETKILFYYLLSNFEIVPIDKTQIPIKFSKKAMNMAVEKGYWVGLKRRNK